MLLFANLSFASSKEILNLSFDVQKSDHKGEKLRIRIPVGEEGTITSQKDNDSNQITVKAIKWKDDLYKIKVRYSAKDELLTNSELIVRANQEAILQDFDAEGNSDYKLTIKASK